MRIRNFIKPAAKFYFEWIMFLDAATKEKKILTNCDKDFIQKFVDSIVSRLVTRSDYFSTDDYLQVMDIIIAFGEHKDTKNWLLSNIVNSKQDTVIGKNLINIMRKLGLRILLN